MSDVNPVPVMVAPFFLDAPPPETAAEESLPEGPRRRRHARAPREGGKRRRGLVIAVLAIAVVGGVASFTGIRLSAPLPVAVVTPTIRHSPLVISDSSPVNLPWTTTGQSAVAIPSVGIDVQSGPEQPAPVASLTKMMTAYVVLHDHPLDSGQNGPNIVISQDDLTDFDTDTVSDQANAQVTLGEVLTERQLLGGMIIHSANDYADALARWDAGSLPAFVAKMNSAAVQLGMDHSHYADPSGFDPASQSTAGDQLKVAAPDMNDPVFASLARMTSITLPVAGTLSTYTPLLGVQGIIGVKSGFTSQAGGCDVVAVIRKVHGLPVLILSAVTGQTGLSVIGKAGLFALNLANFAANAIGSSPIIRSGEVVAHVTAAGHTVNAVASQTVHMLSWPGVRATRVLFDTRHVQPGTLRGTRIGSFMMDLGTQRVVIPVRLSQDLPRESLEQRLF
ncbi:MAG TPA: hypothetical protein VNG12_16755 [Acidimicrobiales bacterium]|nr:hypothetical protein [Acidimicrobiales bacterium]